MSVLEEQWLQDIAESLSLPALNPTIVKMMLPVIEVHIKKIVQQANKFQRRAKATTVTGRTSIFILYENHMYLTLICCNFSRGHQLCFVAEQNRACLWPQST